MTEPLEELLELSDLLIQHKARKKELEDLLSGQNKDIEDIEQKMATLMDEMELQNFTKSGHLFYKYLREFPKIVDFDRFLEWLNQKGESGIAKLTIHPKTLEAWYAQNQDQYAEEISDQKLLSVFSKVHIGVRRGA